MELLSLRWYDVDVQRQVITLPETKNGERRVHASHGACLGPSPVSCTALT